MNLAGWMLLVLLADGYPTAIQMRSYDSCVSTMLELHIKVPETKPTCVNRNPLYDGFRVTPQSVTGKK
jgi:hypothetical protein